MESNKVSRPRFTLYINPACQRKQGANSQILSQKEVDELISTMTNIKIIYSAGYKTHLTAAEKRQILANLIALFQVTIRDLEQYRYLINRPARSAVEFTDFVLSMMRGRRSIVMSTCQVSILICENEETNSP